MRDFSEYLYVCNSINPDKMIDFLIDTRTKFAYPFNLTWGKKDAKPFQMAITFSIDRFI